MPFTCNICGAVSRMEVDPEDREQRNCVCRSTIRLRSVVLCLSRALFGVEIPLSDFPVLKDVHGLGISDAGVYADPLEKHFQYRNTFYDREPFFDLSNPDPKEFGKYDFVICSEVLEHVRPPVETAFATLASLLKPTGVLILTVPYSLLDETYEHFPRLKDSVITAINGTRIMVNRCEDGQYEVFDQLTFHGGKGATLEMRIFCESDLHQKLAAAGFSHIETDRMGSAKFAVLFSDPCSLPITASKGPLVFHPRETPESRRRGLLSRIFRRTRTSS